MARAKNGFMLAAALAVGHGLLYLGAAKLFRISQVYSGAADVLVVGNSRIEQGIPRPQIAAAAPGGADFLASQGMDLKIALRLIESRLDAAPAARAVWLGVDPWQVSDQYGEQGYRNWLPLMAWPRMDAYFREAMRGEPREYRLMKALPLLRFNGVKARLVRTALGLGGVSANRNVVAEAQIREVVSGYAAKPLRVDPAKLAELDSICAAAGRRGIPLRLFFMPVIPELSAPWDIPGFRAAMAEVAARHPGTRFVDFNDQLRDHRFFRDTGHLNGPGARAFAPIFLDSLGT